MIKQQKLMDKALAEKKAKHEEQQRKFAEAQSELESARENQYAENKERATKTLIGNIFTFCIYGAVTARDNKVEEE